MALPSPPTPGECGAGRVPGGIPSGTRTARPLDAPAPRPVAELAGGMGIPAHDAARQVMELVASRAVLDEAAIAGLREWATEIEAWPAGSHVWGHYAEATARGPAICRTENVSACHRGVAALVDGALRDVASDAIGERVVAFKDKINYK